MFRVLTLLSLAVASVSLGYVRAYSVEPQTASQSGWTRFVEPNNYVSQVVTICFDSLAYVELFAGAACLAAARV